jgi:hypothetical protein
MELFERNSLIINKEKTIAISFHQSQKIQLECPSIQLYDKVINYAEHTNILGMWLDKNLRWSTHTQKLANKLFKICFGLFDSFCVCVDHLKFLSSHTSI